MSTLRFLALVVIAIAAIEYPNILFSEIGLAVSLSTLLVLYFVPQDSPSKAVLFDFGGVVSDGDYYTEPIRVRKGIPELIANLKSKDYKVALLTNQNGDVADFLDQKLGLDKLFPVRIASGKIGVKKPDPKIYEYALKKMGSAPQRTFMIDDQLENLTGAKKAGVNGIHFQNVEQVAKQIP